MGVQGLQSVQGCLEMSGSSKITVKAFYPDNSKIKLRKGEMEGGKEERKERKGK